MPWVSGCGPGTSTCVVSPCRKPEFHPEDAGAASKSRSNINEGIRFIRLSSITTSIFSLVVVKNFGADCLYLKEERLEALREVKTQRDYRAKI
jgi:hypothetical protein